MLNIPEFNRIPLISSVPVCFRLPRACPALFLQDRAASIRISRQWGGTWHEYATHNELDSKVIDMNKLHFIGGEKGGVGKSLVSRLLAQYLIDRELPFLGFDTDKSHGALLRFYGDFASPVVVDRYESLDRIVEAAVEEPDRRILVDLAAQTHQFLTRWIEDSGLLDMGDELGMSLVYWHVMDSGRDSVDLLRQLLDQFGARLSLNLVLNEVRGERFDILEASGLLPRARELGARTIGIRRLQDTTMQKIDAHNTSFWAAVNSPDASGAGLGMLERRRVKIWLGGCYAAFDSLEV